MIELRHMRYFVAVAEELHFGRAATRLHMAQSPLSQQIRQLEKELGVELIDRPHSVVGLTDAGTVFLEEARDILQRVDAAVGLTRRAARGEAGILRVGYVGEVTADLLPLGLKAFKERRGKVAIDLTEGTTGVLLDQLRGRSLDVVFVRAPWNVGDISYERLVEETLMLASPAGTVLVPARPVLSDLSEAPWVLPSRDAARGLRMDLEAAFAEAGFEPVAARETSSLTAVLLLVAGGAGCALVPASIAHLYPVPGVDYVDLDEPAPRTSAGMAWRAGDRSELLDGFLAAVRETAGAHEGEVDVWPGRRVAADGRGADPRAAGKG